MHLAFISKVLNSKRNLKLSNSDTQKRFSDNCDDSCIDCTTLIIPEIKVHRQKLSYAENLFATKFETLFCINKGKVLF